ncbi:MAG TPA: hypothetical protein PKB14_11185 [Rubrivivax sp.]|nr:hypothetical protein [Rubrivivax sp.]
MALQVTPIRAEHLEQVGRFLHEQMGRRISAEAWVRSLTHHWAAEVPNHGMQLRDGGRLVGVLLAVYSDQTIGGGIERFCNPHSWCVLDGYRSGSLQLVLDVIRQRGYHFTMYTPNPKVAEVFLGLRFRLLDDRLLYLPHLPAPGSRRGGRFAEDAPERIAARLDGVARAEYEAHRGIPWLRFIAFGGPGDVCLAVYKPMRWKRMPGAHLLHLSDPSALERHGALLRQHLLLRAGLMVTRVEARLLSSVPRGAILSRRTQPKLISSRTLTDGQARDIYSELVALDL